MGVTGLLLPHIEGKPKLFTKSKYEYTYITIDFRGLI